tara:strand:+ start:142 stop:2274 length:2133 start_codon:yes stop_codon:yes gene_type:complete
MGRDLSTPEKLASGNPAVRREGRREAAKQSASQRSKTVSKARDIAGRGYAGTVTPSQVTGPSASQIQQAEVKEMVKKVETQQLQTKAAAVRTQVATQAAITRAAPEGYQRYRAEQFVRFTPGGGQYTQYMTPQTKRPLPATISAAPSWLAVGTRIAREKEEFYKRPDLPRYKQPSKKEPYIPPEYKPETFLEKADVYVISKGTYKIREEGKVPITEALKGTKLYPSVKRYEAKYVEPIQRYKKQLRTEIETKPATFMFKTGATAAASFTIGTALTALPVSATATALKTGTTAVSAGLVAGTVGSGYLRVKGARKGKKAQEFAKVTFDVLPVATGLFIGGAATKAYAPKIKEYATTRIRYYKATGKIKAGKLPLDVVRGTTKYRLTRAGATYTFSKQGVPISKQTRLKPMSASEAAYYSQAARQYTKPAISAKRIKLKPPKLTYIGKEDIRYYGITKGHQKGIKLPKGLKSKFVKKVDIFPKAKKIPFKEQIKGGMQVTQLGKVKTKTKTDVFGKYEGKYYTRTFKPITTVSSYYKAIKPAYTVKTLFGLRDTPKTTLITSPIGVTKGKPILDIFPRQRARGIQRPALIQTPAQAVRIAQRRALLPKQVVLPKLTPDLGFPEPSITTPVGKEFIPRDPWKDDPTITIGIAKPYRPLRKAYLKYKPPRTRVTITQPKEYTPTLRATFLGIKTKKKPKGILTGFGERPIVKFK